MKTTQLLSRVRTAINPVDIIDEMFIVDVVALEWEVLRWRRLKVGLIQGRAFKALKTYLRDHLDYELYRNSFVDDLTEVLQDNLPGGQEKDFAQTLAHRCAENESEAVDQVKKIFAGVELDLDQFQEDVRVEKV